MSLSQIFFYKSLRWLKKVPIFVIGESFIPNQIPRMLSKASMYAIQSLAYLTIHGKEGSYVPISQIAAELAIPYHFLKKILAQLSQTEILTSQRSAKGGVALGLDPKAITLYDIIVHMDGASLFNGCILGLPGCGNAKPCPLHNAWAIERKRLQLLFSSTSLFDLARRIETEGFRISL